MTIKITAPKAWSQDGMPSAKSFKTLEYYKPVRIVSDSDWRKLMRLVKAAEEYEHAYPSEVCGICEALAALEKKK